MKIRFEVNDAETLAQLHGLSIDAFVEGWAEAVLQLAKKNAREKIGGKFGEKTVAGSIEQQSHGVTAEVYTGGPSGYIAEHVQTGGVVRSRNGKPLAIPLPNEATDAYNPNRLFARELKLRLPLFKLRSKKGNDLLFRKPGKGEKLEKPLFVLKAETRPQAPRPWWPTDAEVEKATMEFFEENF